MPGIFISYRRDDSSAYAGRLYDHLSNHFGKSNVFMDVDNIDYGLDFVEVIQERVSSCDALIAVIGKQWLVITDETGQRRLDDAEDFVRVEVAAALERKVRVVPVLVGGARMPRAQDLPEVLAPLSRRNFLEVSDLAFQQSVGRLIDTLEKIIQGPPAPGPAPPPLPLPKPLPVPYANVPRWRKRLLFYRPRGGSFSVFCAWIFRLVFWLAAVILAVLLYVPFGDPHAMGESSYWLTLVTEAVVTALVRFTATRFDKRAARKLAKL